MLEGIFFHIEASVTQNKVKSLCKKKVVSCAEKVIGPLLIKSSYELCRLARCSCMKAVGRWQYPDACTVAPSGQWVKGPGMYSGGLPPTVGSLKPGLMSELTSHGVGSLHLWSCSALSHQCVLVFSSQWDMRSCVDLELLCLGRHT